MLNKAALQSSLEQGIKKLLVKRQNDTNEDGNPESIINGFSSDLAKLLAEAIDTYVRTGSVTVGPTNIAVTCAAPGSPGTVISMKPASIS